MSHTHTHNWARLMEVQMDEKGECKKRGNGLRVQLWQTGVSVQHVESASSPSKPLTVTEHLRNTAEILISACITVKSIVKHHLKKGKKEKENDCNRIVFLKYLFSILDIIHPFLGQLPVGTASSYTAADLYRSDEDSRTWNSRFSWRCPPSASHQRAGQRDSQVHIVWIFKLSSFFFSCCRYITFFFFFNFHCQC